MEQTLPRSGDQQQGRTHPFIDHPESAEQIW
jgi:hypothetical protein